MTTACALELGLSGSDCHRQVPLSWTTVPQRTLRWLHTEIDFIDHPEFRHATPQGGVSWADAPQAAEPQRAASRELPAHLARLCEADLLTADQERQLFRSMNYLKFRANALRSQLDPAVPEESVVEEIERLLDESRRLRDRLIRANMRLAISVVKKFVSPRRSFDDMLSDGIVSLMQAVDKFDFSRGFRFSTYAYRAIARNAFRKMQQEQKEAARLANQGDQVFELESQGSSSSLDERSWERLRGVLSELMGRLDRREQFIVRGRYALGGHRKVKTFQSLADKLGLSKERVRQLEQRAVAKLRQWSDDLQAVA